MVPPLGGMEEIGGRETKRLGKRPRVSAHGPTNRRSQGTGEDWANKVIFPLAQAPTLNVLSRGRGLVAQTW